MHPRVLLQDLDQLFFLLIGKGTDPGRAERIPDNLVDLRPTVSGRMQLFEKFF